MIEPLNKKYAKIVTKIVYEGLSLRNLTDHALQYKSRYQGREGFRCRNDHDLANDIVRSVLKNPQASKIAVAGFERKADGRVRYVAYAYSPALGDVGVAKIITADTQYPPTKFLQPQILTTYRERLTSGIKQMLDEVMPIAYIMEGKTDDEFRAEQEMLRDIQVDVPNMDKLHGKYFEIMSSRNKTDKSIARLFDAAEGNYMDVPYETMKDLVLSRSKMNKTLSKLHQMIRRIKPNFKEPDVVVNTIPSDEYESLLKEYIEVGAKQYDKRFAEYMTPEDVEDVNATFKSLDEKLATSAPAQTEGVARMESMEAQYKAFIESVCAEFGCTDAIRPLQEGFTALCEAVYLPNGQPERLDSTRYAVVYRDIPLNRHERMNQIYDNAINECDRLDRMSSDEFLRSIGKDASDITEPRTREQALDELKAVKNGMDDCKVLKSTPSMIAYVNPKNKYGIMPNSVKLCMIKPVQFAGLTSGADPEWALNPSKRADNRNRRWKRAELDLPYAKAFRELRRDNPSSGLCNSGKSGNDFDNYIGYAVDRATTDSRMFGDRPNDIETWVDEKRKNGQPTDIRSYEEP